MEHCNTYRVQLGKAYPSLGHALWEPGPRELGPSGQYPLVGVGDVGFIREGRFKRLFNVLLPADHPFHDERHGVPDNYEQLQLHPTLQDHIDCGILRPNDFFSPGIKILSGGLKVLTPG